MIPKRGQMKKPLGELSKGFLLMIRCRAEWSYLRDYSELKIDLLKMVKW